MSEPGRAFSVEHEPSPRAATMTSEELDRMRAEWEALPYGSREQGEKKKGVDARDV